MKVSNVILIGVVVIAVVILAVREWTRTGPEQVRSSVTSAERLPPSAGTEQRRSPASAAEPPASELPQEESAIADAPQGHEQGGKTPTEQEQTGKNVYEHGPPVAAELFDGLVSPGPPGTQSWLEPMHQRFSEEQPDPSWSPNVESQLQSFLQNEETTKLFDVVSMGCRTTICEIRAVAPSKELSGQSVEALQNRIFTMHRESWWTGYGLKVPAFGVIIAPDGRAIMVAYVATH